MGLPAEWECVGFSEIDKNAIKVLKYRYGGIRNYGDIEKIDYGELPDFDILVGGSPCQDVSLAGKREGLAGLRSRLFFSYASILKIKRPHYFLFENVKGLISSNGGRDFARVLTELSEPGYDIWWQVLDSAWFGIPQHRERVFIFGSLGGGTPRKVLFKPADRRTHPELQGHTANTLTRRYRASEATGSYVVESQLNAQIENVRFSKYPEKRIYGTGGLAPTIHRKNGGGQVAKIAIPVRDLDGGFRGANGRQIKTNNEPSFTIMSVKTPGLYDGQRIRYLTPLECERLMGWPDDWTRFGIDDKGRTVELSDNARYSLIGNGVVPQVVSAIIDKVMPKPEKMTPHNGPNFNERGRSGIIRPPRNIPAGSERGDA